MPENGKTSVKRSFYPIPRISSDKLAIVGFFIGFGMILNEISNSPIASKFLPVFSEILKQNGWMMIGAILIFISGEYLKSRTQHTRKEERFIDVDDRIEISRGRDSSFIKKINRDSGAIKKLTEEIEALKRAQPDIDYEKVEDLVRRQLESTRQLDQELVKSFDSYFNGIRSTLEEKAASADRKASILLDKGTVYAQGGIKFFIISIVVWQTLSWLNGFETQYIYGMASCSVVFIFIEFLSAWFLKQYRQFVDTSTYLIKVKSIFDRYMLAYLVFKELSGDGKEKLYEMIELLRDDIKWPETYLLKNSDISFTKEAMETMNFLLKNMRDTVKEESRKG
jgi:hypothetical protein